MKTRKLLTFTLSLAFLTFINMNVIGQENASWIDMTADQATTDSVVVGSTMPYYVEPDGVINNLSGQYDPSSPMAGQGINSTFLWQVVTATGAVTFNDPAADGADAPYQTVTFPGTAEDGIEIGVSEVAPGAGGCSGSQRVVTIDVIEAPSFTVNDDSKNLEVCDGAQETIEILTLAADGIAQTSNYYFLTDISQEMVDADGNPIGTPVVGDYPHTDSIIPVKTTDGADIPVLENYTFTCGDDGTNDRITEYTFDFSKGINNHITRKSDYLDFTTTGALGSDDRGKENPSSEGTEVSNYTWYTPTGGTTNAVTVTVYPQPTTGNIYHVGNKFEL